MTVNRTNTEKLIIDMMDRPTASLGRVAAFARAEQIEAAYDDLGQRIFTTIRDWREERCRCLEIATNGVPRKDRDRTKTYVSFTPYRLDGQGEIQAAHMLEVVVSINAATACEAAEFGRAITTWTNEGRHI